MIHHFRMAKFWQMVILVGAPLIIALFVWAIVQFVSQSHDWGLFLFLVVVCLAMIILMLLAMAEALISKITIDHEKIIARGILGKRQLLFREIKGYRFKKNYIEIEAHNKQKRKIQIGNFTAQLEDISFLLSAHCRSFDDLTFSSFEELQQEILQESAFGKTPQQRQAKLNRDKKLAKTLKLFGWTCALWLLFYPKPYYLYIMLFAIFFFIFTLTVVKLSNGLMRVNDKDDSPYPFVGEALVLPALVIGVRGLLDYNIIGYHNIGLPTVLLMLFLMAILLFKNKEFSLQKIHDLFVLLLFSAFFFAYSFGVLVFFNCQFDNSPAQVFSAKVLKKRVLSGKMNTYYIVISKWQATSKEQDSPQVVQNPQPQAQEVHVDKNLYSQLKEGDTVKIYFQKGRLDMPWFTVRK